MPDRISDQKKQLLFLLREETNLPMSTITQLCQVAPSTAYKVLGNGRPTITQAAQKTTKQPGQKPPPRAVVLAASDRPQLTADELTRFMARINMAAGQGPNGNCWFWTGSKSGPPPYQYGVFDMRGRKISARVISWYAHFAQYPKGPVAATCRQSLCVNPKHLLELKNQSELGTFMNMMKQRP